MNIQNTFIDCNSNPLAGRKVLFTPLQSPAISSSWMSTADSYQFTTSLAGVLSASVVANTYKVDISSPLPATSFYLVASESGSYVYSGSVQTGTAQDVYFDLFNLVKDSTNIKKVTLTPQWSYPVTFGGNIIAFFSTSSVPSNGYVDFDQLVPAIYQVDVSGKVTTTFFISVPTAGGSWNAKDLIVVKPSKGISVKVNGSDNSYVLTVSSSDARYILHGGSISSASYAATASFAMNGGGGGGGTGLATGSDYPFTSSWADTAVLAQTANNVGIGTTNTNFNYLVTFVSSSSGPQPTWVSPSGTNNLFFNPSTFTLTVPIVSASLYGNAVSANSVLVTPNTISANIPLVTVSGSNGIQQATVDSGLTYNQSTQTLTVQNHSGTASLATKAINVGIGSTTGNITWLPMFVQNTTGYQATMVDGNITSPFSYNSSTQILTVKNIVGTASFATSASYVSTLPQTISLNTLTASINLLVGPGSDDSGVTFYVSASNRGTGNIAEFDDMNGSECLQITYNGALILSSSGTQSLAIGSNQNTEGVVVNQNLNNGNTASADFIATNNNGNLTTYTAQYYIDFGINSSGYAYPFIGTANDSYVFCTSSNSSSLFIGNIDQSGSVYLFAGGYANTGSGLKITSQSVSTPLAFTCSAITASHIGNTFGTASQAVSSSYSAYAVNASSTNTASALYSYNTSTATLYPLGGMSNSSGVWQMGWTITAITMNGTRGSVNATSFTGSLLGNSQGTSSWATNALTASLATTASYSITASAVSYTINLQSSASWASSSYTASYLATGKNNNAAFAYGTFTVTGSTAGAVITQLAYNSTITRQGLGIYSVQFTNAASNQWYAVSACGSSGSATAPTASTFAPLGRLTTGFTMSVCSPYTGSNTSVLTDPNTASYMVFGY